MNTNLRQPSRIPPVPHPLDIAPLEQLPNLLKRFWLDYHSNDGMGFSQADLDAATRAHARLHDHTNMREQASNGGHPGTFRVIVGMAILFVGASVYQPGGSTDVWGGPVWGWSASLVTFGMAIIAWGARAAHNHAVMDVKPPVISSGQSKTRQVGK